MTNVSLCRQAYAKYIALGLRAIMSTDLFPEPLAKIIQLCIGVTKSEFYRFVLTKGRVIGVSFPYTPPKTKDTKLPHWWKDEYLVAIRIDETLLHQSELEFHKGDTDFLKQLRNINNMDKFPIDVIFESEAAMYAKIMAFICTQPAFIHLPIEHKYDVSVLIRESMYESFAKEADQLLADMV